MQIRICFDGIGREIELIDVTHIENDVYRIEINPIFNEEFSYGDLIKLRADKNIYYYTETVQKSNMIRHSWLLSKEVIESKEIEEFKEWITNLNRKWEQAFGGLLIINIPNDVNFNKYSEINKLFDKLR